MAGKGSPKGVRQGGRKKGTPNKVTADIRAAARVHGPAMIVELARIAKNSESDAARVSAIKEVLDRAYGKSPQPIDGDGEGGPVKLQVGWLKPEE